MMEISAGIMFVILHALVSFLSLRVDVARRLRSQSRSHKEKQKELRDKLLKSKEIRLRRNTDEQNLKPWMSIFNEDGIRGVDRLLMQLTAAGYRSERALMMYFLVRALSPFLGGFGGYIVGTIFFDAEWIHYSCSAVLAVGSWFAVPYQLTQKAR